MASQAEIQAQIDQIVTGAKYPANSMRPLLTSMLDFASAGQTVVFDGLVANNTTMEDTTLVLEYGVNIVVTATLTDYACRLPIPVTGKRVIVVNRSLINISLFPSMEGGQINNLPINTPATIPPDGAAYDFICIENPLPGAWVWSPPAIAQYDSGDITADTTSAASNNYIYASSPLYAAERTSASSTSAFVFNGLNNPLIINSVPPLPLPNSAWHPQFKPAVAWNGITKVKVYTNISSNGLVGTVKAGLAGARQQNTYTANTTTFISDGIGNAPTNFIPTFDLLNIIPGTVPAPGVTTNIGDTGTVWGEVTLNGIGTRVGDTFLSTDGTEDIWETAYITMKVIPRLAAVGIKFRFFIEYM